MDRMTDGQRRLKTLPSPLRWQAVIILLSDLWFAGATVYTQVFNVLNFPTGSVPVTKVTAEDEAALATYPTVDPWHRLIKKVQCNLFARPPIPFKDF